MWNQSFKQSFNLSSDLIFCELCFQGVGVIFLFFSDCLLEFGSFYTYEASTFFKFIVYFMIGFFHRIGSIFSHLTVFPR